jgi:predicted acetyltransferase
LTEITVRTCTDLEEFRGALGAIWQYFGGEPTDESIDRFRRVLEFERMHAAFDVDRIVGGGGVFNLEMTVPGGSLACAAVTVVGVDPTHRRRGILTGLMRAQLDAAYERGDPIAALWASEATIYGRFGYGLSSLSGEIDLPRERTGFSVPLEPTEPPRFLSVDEALEHFAPIYDRVLVETPGMLSRSRAWWESRVLADPEARRFGGGPARRVLIENGGEPVAYAIYHHHPRFDHGSSTGSIRVVEAFGTTPQAMAAVWRYLLDVDWIASINASLLPLDHPLFLLLAEPRRMRFTIMDALWLRLVDVGAALSRRGYADGGEVVFEVADAFCPWNEGRWRLAGGLAERTAADADIRLAVNALGSAFLGGFTFAELARAGRLEELRSGSIARADAMFRSDRLPWCPEIF